MSYVTEDFNGEEIIWTFYEKELKKANQIEYRIEKVIKEKGDKSYVKWRGHDNLFNSLIDKKILLHKMSYFQNRIVIVKTNKKKWTRLSNYATKSDLKRAIGIEESEFAKTTDLASLKSKVDKVDIDKLQTVPFDLSQFRNLVKKLLLKILHMVNWLKRLILLIQNLEKNL